MQLGDHDHDGCRTAVSAQQNPVIDARHLTRELRYSGSCATQRLLNAPDRANDHSQSAVTPHHQAHHQRAKRGHEQQGHRTRTIDRGRDLETGFVSVAPGGPGSPDRVTASIDQQQSRGAIASGIGDQSRRAPLRFEAGDSVAGERPLNRGFFIAGARLEPATFWYEWLMADWPPAVCRVCAKLCLIARSQICLLWYPILVAVSGRRSREAASCCPQATRMES